jgi:hypothetical protein
MKLLRLLAVLFLSTVGAFAQQQGNPGGQPPPGIFSVVELPLLTDLPPVRNANVAVVGNPGNGTYYYWLVTNYTFGQAPVQGPFIAINAPTVLTSGNYVTITPDYLPGATVDVLKTTSLTPPSGTGSYALSTGNTSGAISDQGGALSSYTLNPANPSGQTNCLSTQAVGSGSAHLYLTQGTDCQTFIADLTAIGTSTGTVTNLTSGNLSPLFTTSIANPTTTPALTFALTNAGAYSVFGNFTGTSAAPGYSATPIFNGLTLNTSLTLDFVTGATPQCLHASTLGVVTGTGSDCGSGGGGIGGSGTAGYLPEFTASTTLGNSPIRDTSGVLEASEYLQIANQGATLPVNTIALLAESTFTSSACGTGGGINTFLFQPNCQAAIEYVIPETASTGVVAGIFAQAQPQALSGAPAVTAVYGWAATNGNGSPNYLTGMVGVADASPGVTGTIANLTGVEGLAFLQGPQTATLMAGLAGQVQNQNSGLTQPFGAALYARSPTIVSGAVITDIYGLYIADQTVGGGTVNPNPFGIYEAGAAPNVLNGSLSLLNLGGTTQCLESVAGLITGTGAACGSGGSLPSGTQGNDLINTSSGSGTTYAARTNVLHTQGGGTIAAVFGNCGASPTPCRVIGDPAAAALTFSAPLVIGSSTQQIIFENQGQALEATDTTGGRDGIDVAQWGSLDCIAEGVGASNTGCDVYSSTTANITSLLTNLVHDGTQANMTVRGINFVGNGSATYSSGGLVNIVALEGHAELSDIAISGVANSSTLLMQDGPATGDNASIVMQNDSFDCTGKSGCIGVNLQSTATGTGNGSNYTFVGGGAGDTLGGSGCILNDGCIFNIDGSQQSGHFLAGVAWYNPYFEGISGMTGSFVEAKNVKGLHIDDFVIKGGTGLTNCFYLASAGSTQLGMVEITGRVGGTPCTNLINNAATGTIIPDIAANSDVWYLFPGQQSIGAWIDGNLNLGAGGLLTLYGSTSGTATVQASATGSLLYLNGSNSTVSTAGAATFAASVSVGTSGAGTVAISNSANTFTNTLASVATANNTFNFPAAVFANGDLGYCVVSATTCTWTDAGYAFNSIPNADLAHSAITIAGTPVSLGSSTTSFPSPGAIGGTTPAAITGTAITANTSLLSGNSGVPLGSTSAPFSNLFFYGGGTYGTDSFELTGTSTANRTVTFPDNTGTVAELNLAETFSANQTLTGHIIMSGHDVAIPLVCSDSSGSGTAQSCTTSPSYTPAAGDSIIYTTTTSNSGAALTINVNSLGAKSVAKWQNSTTLAANDVRSGSYTKMTYDGTNWEIDTIGNAPSGGSGGSLDQITGAAAQATGTETAAGHNYTFAGVETSNLTSYITITDANSTNNNTNIGLLVGATGTSTGEIGQVVFDVSGTGDIWRAYTGGSVSNGTYTVGTLQANLDHGGDLTIQGIMTVNGGLTESSSYSAASGSTNTTFEGGTGSANQAGTAGGIILKGMDNTSSTNNAGPAILRPGGLTGTTPSGLQGTRQEGDIYFKGATVTQWNVQCHTTTAQTTADCAASATVANMIGVATNTTAPIFVVDAGTVPINATAAVTIGDTVCLSAVTAGKVTDSGGTGNCTVAFQTVGVVVATSGTFTVASGTGAPTTATATTTLPMVKLTGNL